jgi:hypothetical protein
MLIVTFVSGMMTMLCSMQAAAGTAKLTWQQPTTNEDGTPLTDFAGYKIYYGTSSGVYTNKIDVGKVQTYQMQSLADGVTYYFNVTAYNTGLLESGYATEVSMTIPASQNTLSVVSAGTGSGAVTSAPAGISCGTICSSSFAAGTSVTLTATPNASSIFTGWSGACSGTGTCAVTMSAAKSATATFAIKTFTISASAGANGTITPSGTVSVNYGTTKAFTITPAAGYHVANVLVDGSSIGAVTSYSFTNVFASHSISATFAANTYTITPSVGANGTISPSVPQTVNQNATTSFTVTPNSGYAIASVTGCGGTLIGTTYTTGPATANCTVTATFAAKTYTITPSVGANGTISPSVPQTVNQNATTSFTVTPNSGYAIASVTGCGGTLIGTTYTTGPATANCTVTASFTASALNTLTVTRSGSGSVVSLPAGIDCGQICSSSFIGGTAVSLTATPASGWTFAGWTGACTGTGACTVAMNSSKAVSALFSDTKPPELAVSTLPDGSVTRNQDLNVSGTVKDTGGMQSLIINGSVIPVQSDNTFSYLVTLLSGRNTISTVATDLAGNKTTDTRTVTLDQATPSLTITAPADNSTTANAIVTVTGTVSETSTVSIVLNSGAPQIASMSGTTFTATVILQPGLNTITATALDSVGNPSTAVKRTVVYDNQKPSVAITTPPADFTTSQSSIAIQGTVTNSLSASTASISVDGITTPLLLDGTGKFSATAVLAAEGPHTVAVTATNQAGVSTSVQRNVQYTMLGDLNSSGSVDLADAVLAFRHITGEQPITDDVTKKRCDVAPLGTDGRPQPDGEIALGDVVIILRRVVGLTNW